MADQRVLVRAVFTLSIVAAFAIGVSAALWATRDGSTTPPDPGSAPRASPAPDAGTAPTARVAEQSTPTNSTGVFINGIEATRAQLDDLRNMYGAAPPAGQYWYDTRSGLYGAWGHEAAGYIRPGHHFGDLPEDASNGNTGVFINGRNINMTEAMFFQRIFGAVYQGRWWLDGATGNVGMEGNQMPIANIVVALQQAQRSGGGDGGGYRWRDEINRSSGGAENGCVWVNMPGTSYSSSGCD